MSRFSESESKLVVVISLDDQIEPGLLLAIQGLRDGQLARVRMDLEVSDGGWSIQEVGDLEIEDKFKTLSLQKLNKKCQA